LQVNNPSSTIFLSLAGAWSILACFIWRGQSATLIDNQEKKMLDLRGKPICHYDVQTRQNHLSLSSEQLNAPT